MSHFYFFRLHDYGITILYGSWEACLTCDGAFVLCPVEAELSTSGLWLVCLSCMSAAGVESGLSGVPQVSSLLLAPSPLMALLPLGLQTGLVLDIGYQEAVCVPVYEGVPVLRAWQALPLAGRALHRSVSSAHRHQQTVPRGAVQLG